MPGREIRASWLIARGVSGGEGQTAIPKATRDDKNGTALSAGISWQTTPKKYLYNADDKRLLNLIW